MKVFNELEASILKWICEHYADTTLPAQLTTARFKNREYTGSGFYIYFEVDQAVPPSNVMHPRRWPLDGPVILSPVIDGPAEVLLWGDDSGYANCIEIFSYGDRFPETITPFQLLTYEEYGTKVE